ncbi:MAG: AAA family ATPase [Lachnospiraceae bacterium]|nr:AAA family ATPase [Lachnospiraceae bacterium]
MGKVISVANQKGGVGKTTTTINLAAALGEAGKKVLVIDMDPQGNTTSGMGVDKNEEENTIYELMLGESVIGNCIKKDVVKNVSLIPANVDFAAAEVELIGIEKSEFILKNQLEKVKNGYDFILIDCPPSLSTLTVNALTTSDSVLVPIQCEYYALEGLSQLIHTINLIRQRLNNKINIEGVVFTMYDSRTNLSSQVVENVKANFAYTVFDTVIPRNTRLAEAPSFGMPVLEYDSKAPGSEAYRALAKEVIKNNR